MNTLAFGFGSFTTMDMLLIMGLALLLFGKRLPEVGKSLGKGIVEFKKGLKGIDEDVSQSRDARDDTRRELPPQDAQYRAPLPQSQDDRRVVREAPADRVDDYRQSAVQTEPPAPREYERP